MQKRLVTLLQNHNAEPVSIDLTEKVLQGKAIAAKTLAEVYHGAYGHVASKEEFESALTIILGDIENLVVNADAILSNAKFAIAYSVHEVQIVSDAAMDKIEQLIDEPANPTPALKELMLGKRRYELREDQLQKTLSVNITGDIGSGKTTAAAILYKFLKAAGVDVEMKSDDIKDLPSDVTMVDLAGWLRDRGTKVVITDGKLLSEPKESFNQVFRPVPHPVNTGLTIDQLVVYISNYPDAVYALKKLSEGRIDESTQSEVIKEALIELSCLGAAHRLEDKNLGGALTYCITTAGRVMLDLVVAKVN